MHIIIFELNCALCFNACKFIKYILKTKTSLKWSIYSFKIDLHVLKVLKTSLEVQIWKNKSATFDWLQVVDRIECSRPKMAEYCFIV